jgi:predicted nucleotidyltransferase
MGTMLEMPYRDINKLLESLLYQMRQVFQEKLAGLYLYGSLASGDFDPDSSDIDLLVVTTSKITARNIEALRIMHRDFTRDNPAWEDRIDVVYLSAKAIKEFRTEKGPVVISRGEPLHVREGEPLKDWLQNWYIIRENGQTIYGLPAKSVIPPITREEFVEAVRRYAVEVGERVKHEINRGEQAYIILTICRVLHVIKTGKQASKREAALWAQEELPEWSKLIQNAIDWKQAWLEENINHAETYSETAKFVNFMRELILI